MLKRQNSHFFHEFILLPPDDSTGRIARELWWVSQEFFPASTIILSRSYITCGMKKRPVGDPGSGMQSHPHGYHQSIRKERLYKENLDAGKGFLCRC
jgi:hypothetical protein